MKKKKSMSKGEPSVDVFDLQRIRQIVELMEQHELSELDLQQGDDRIRLARGGKVQPMMVASQPIQAAPPVATVASSPGHTAGADTSTLIRSPMVGTFYGRANPESEPFVKVGMQVSEDTIVCIVEAMKVFNEIPAECRGRIVEVLVNDQQPVDFGKPLFRIEPSA
jgi:acetyl-CoA carboxylase biotin carboxyl carrier protein